MHISILTYQIEIHFEKINLLKSIKVVWKFLQLEIPKKNWCKGVGLLYMANLEEVGFKNLMAIYVMEDLTQFMFRWHFSRFVGRG